MSKPRLTREQAAAVDADCVANQATGALAPSYCARGGMSKARFMARILDLLDQVSEVQRDREMLAEAIRMAMSDAPGLVQLTPAQQRAFDRAFGRSLEGK